MRFADLYDMLSGMPGVTQEFPFGPTVLVFKVMGKMFALINPDQPEWVNLKCDPERSAELREKYDGITPGFHMNKKYWNTVRLDGSVPPEVVRHLLGHSYDQVAAGLPKKLRHELEALTNKSK